MQPELQSRRKEGTERGPRQQVLRSPPALGKKELKVDASQQVLGSPRQSRENEKRLADQSNTPDMGADQVSRVEEWNCGTWKEERRVASPEGNGCRNLSERATRIEYGKRGKSIHRQAGAGQRKRRSMANRKRGSSSNKAIAQGTLQRSGGA